MEEGQFEKGLQFLEEAVEKAPLLSTYEVWFLRIERWGDFINLEERKKRPGNIMLEVYWCEKNSKKRQPFSEKYYRIRKTCKKHFKNFLYCWKIEYGYVV